MTTPLKTRTVKQSVLLPSSPQEIFALLMESRKHSRFTGSTAVIDARPGGKFSAYDGYIEGTNLEIEPGKKIVQRWRGRDWPAGHYSTVTFLFKKAAASTRVEFTHQGIPAAEFEGIKQGWNDFYWKRMKDYLKDK